MGQPMRKLHWKMTIFEQPTTISTELAEDGRQSWRPDDPALESGHRNAVLERVADFALKCFITVSTLVQQPQCVCLLVVHSGSVAKRVYTRSNAKPQISSEHQVDEHCGTYCFRKSCPDLVIWRCHERVTGFRRYAVTPSPRRLPRPIHRLRKKFTISERQDLHSFRQVLGKDRSARRNVNQRVLVNEIGRASCRERV